MHVCTITHTEAAAPCVCVFGPQCDILFASEARRGPPPHSPAAAAAISTHTARVQVFFYLTKWCRQGIARTLYVCVCVPIALHTTTQTHPTYTHTHTTAPTHTRHRLITNSFLSGQGKGVSYPFLPGGFELLAMGAIPCSLRPDPGP